MGAWVKRSLREVWVSENSVRVLKHRDELDEWIASPGGGISIDGERFIYRDRWATDVDLRPESEPGGINERGWRAARLYWLNDQATWRAVGDTMGVSLERARSLANRAIQAARDVDPNDPFTGLGRRVANTLRRAGFASLEEARAVGIDELMKIPNCGRKTAEEIMGWGP